MVKTYNNIFYCTNDSGKNACYRRDFLIKNTRYLITYHYVLGFSSKFSYVQIFERGKKVFEKEFNYYKGRNVFIKNIFYYLYYFYILVFYVKKDTYIIVTFPAYCMLNSIISLFKRIEIIFWIEDYFPPINKSLKIYNLLVDYYQKRLKYVIYISPRIAEIYSKQKILNKAPFREVVSLGIKQNKLQKKKIKKRVTLGFMGIIRKQQGLDLVFEYLKLNKKVYLEVIGEGYDLLFYKNLAKKMDILEQVKFYGRVEDKNVNMILKKWNIALALYENIPSNLSVYCEPSKIKTYLSYGLPVITTDTTYFHKELSRTRAGEMTKENVESLSNAIKNIIGNYDLYIDGVTRISEKYSYENWYRDKFRFIK